MTTDYIILVLAFWCSLSIRINEFYTPSTESLYLILFAPLLAIPIFYFFGLYKSLIRYSNYQSLIVIMIATTIYSFLWFIIVIVSSIVIKPYDFLIINFLLSNLFTGGIRYLARWFLIHKDKNYTSVLIYGAGSAGIQLRSAIWHSDDIKVEGFIDNDQKIQGNVIDGLKIYSPDQIEKIIKQKNISEVILAMPSLNKSKVQELLNQLKKYSLVIRVLPSVSEIAKGNVSISDLKTINIQDLLKREIRKPSEKLLNRDINNKNILVTGAGGSIGSELCRQITNLRPKSLMLLDISESSLYQIESELLEKKLDIPILTIIANVTNQPRLERIIKRYNVNTIYHAAAYKHVPMVEKNTIAGVRCNIFGTLSCSMAAINNDVESFVFISTDKAVRPTNIMGATKRFAEMVLQAIAKEQLTKEEGGQTRISIVRFGNVLGSSGSVVPLFRSQIKKGGPVTVTDPDIIRYFMTLKEAGQLVIQAGSMSKTGDIFLLDMGDPMKVIDLAKDMIQLSGKTIRDKNNPEGDIEIIFTGLRPGEKLYEELLIDEKSESTEHKQIMRALDNGINWKIVKIKLSELEQAIDEESYDQIKKVFLEIVSGYKPN